MTDRAGGVVRVVFTDDMEHYDPNAASLHVGDWVADDTGSGPDPRQVVRLSTGGPMSLLNLQAGFVIRRAGTVFLPGAGGSGDGQLNIAVDNRVGVLAGGELVDVDIISSAAITSVGIAGGIGVLASALVVGFSARVRVAADNGGSAGLIQLLVNGTTGATYQFVIAPVRASAFDGQSVTQAFLTGTLP